MQTLPLVPILATTALATTLAGVPPLWVQLLEADWPAETAARLRRLTNSGGALTERLVRGLRGRFPQAEVVAMYGLTEAFRSTWLDPALIDAHPDAMGRAIPFAEVMAVRADGARAIGEPGEGTSDPTLRGQQPRPILRPGRGTVGRNHH